MWDKQDSANSGIDRLAGAAETFIKQERWSRRWTNLLKLAVIAYILFTLVMIGQRFAPTGDAGLTPEHTAVIKLDGAIMPNSPNSAEVFNALLRDAFASEQAKAVLIRANSPGGSPVQSALINDEIKRLKQKHNKPLYVVVEDVCASGCYYIAVAADEIYANKGSIVGSIGVRMDTFGFTQLMDKVGIENRSMHAGEHKSFIDPFGPKDKAGRAFFKERILERTHQQFIETVRQGRGDRLKETDNTFTGLVWLGDEAVEHGLIDGLGDVGFVARDKVGTQQWQTYETERSFVEDLMNNIGAQTAAQLHQYLYTLK